MLQFLIAFDQLINTIFGGYADETISARLYRNKKNSIWWLSWYKIVNNIFFWQKNHCYESFLSEQDRTQLPKTYRDKV